MGDGGLHVFGRSFLAVNPNYNLAQPEHETACMVCAKRYPYVWPGKEAFKKRNLRYLRYIFVQRLPPKKGDIFF